MSNTNPGGINRHKALAMGKNVATMKKGGTVKAAGFKETDTDNMMKKGGKVKKSKKK